jgi:ribosome-binding protein aMBF1 (putative translation factor)
MKIIYKSGPFYAAGWMEKSGPRLTANRKQQKALLSLLRQLRTEAGLRQVDMAKALGKPQAFVSYYESGARRLDLLELRQICGILGIPLIELVRKFEKLLQ